MNYFREKNEDKHISFVSGKNDKEYYLNLVDNSMDICIYKLSIL
jgi:hypothetical protein